MSVEKAKNVPPFVLWCSAAIPTAFDDSMSYYEALCALYRFIQDNLVEPINNNATVLDKAVKDLAALKEYVDNYFENLDVQTEINNKLDAMAEGGQLSAIITQFLAAAPVFAYHTIAEMSSATNLNNGCIARVIGNTTATDGDGAYYLIRTRTGADSPDGLNLVAIGDSLVGVRVVNYGVENLQAQVNLINGNDTIFLGDSYAAGTTYEHGSVEFLTSWCEYLRQIMGLTTGHYYIYAQGNAGFAKIGNNSMNFQMTLASHVDEIQNKDRIKNIIVCAGYNDNDQTTSLIYQRVGEFISYCKSIFPNATVYIGMIGGNAADTVAASNVRENLIGRVLNAYSRCGDFGGVYLTGVELFSHNYYQFNDQGNHPNEAGYKYVARMIYNVWKGGATSIDEPITSVVLDTNFGNTLGIQGQMSNGTKTIYVDNYTAGSLTLEPTDTIEIVPANHDNKIVKPMISGKTTIPAMLTFKTSANVRHYAPAKLMLGADGSVILNSIIFAFIHDVVEFSVWSNPTTFNMLNS